MSRKWFSLCALVAAATFLLNASSCGFNQHLISIQIQPAAGGTFGAADPSLFFLYQAYGTYSHPPQTKNITDQVTWASDNPQVIQVSTTGVASPNLNCGIAQIYATFYDSPNDIVSNYASITVDGFSPGCTAPSPEPLLTVSFAGLGTGTVTGNGISCSSPSSCSNQFIAGTTVTLTAVPTGSSVFSSWTNCNSTSGVGNSVCTVLVETNTTVTATFSQ